MDAESSDILGGRLPVTSIHQGRIWAPISFSQLLSLIVVAALGVWIVVQHVIPWNRKRQEILYRKAMRRRHGIPDTDHRPFNVAYAAAMQARKQREAGGRQRRGGVQVQASIATSSQPHSISATAQFTRQRTNHIEHTTTQPYTLSDTTGDGTLPVGTASENAGGHAVNRVVNSRGPRARSSSNASSAALRPSRAKHRLEDEVDLEDGNEPKKSRVEDDELIDDDPDSVYEETDEGMDVDAIDEGIVNPKRGSKRSTSQDDDEGISMSRSHTRDKRARRVFGNKSKEHVLDNSMEEADDVSELQSIPRGKKRDRVEAGSTFGGDESLLEDEEEKPRHHRRRRMVSHRKSNTAARGQKRGRDVIDSMESDEGSELSSKRSARQKRGKRGSEDGYLSLDDGMISHDPLCKGRHIGEEWESNGVTYKVGPNGQRLRQALVKKARSLFSMPKDSHHPDREANVQVFVETWLSDDEYQQAKDNLELAWQESPPLAVSPATSAKSTSPRVGKNLLWSSISTPAESPNPRRGPLRQSMGSNASLRVNPVQQSLAASGRRISTSHSPVIISPDSPKPRTKLYSKWEKQDLEAAAMAKLREKAQKTIVAQVKPSITPTTTPIPGFSSANTANIAATIKPEEKSATKTNEKVPASFSFPAPPKAAPPPDLTAPPASTTSLPSATPSIATPAQPPKMSTSSFPALSSMEQQKSAFSSGSGFSFAKPPITQPPMTNAPPAPAPVAPTLFKPMPSTSPSTKVEMALPSTSNIFTKPSAPVTTQAPAFTFAPMTSASGPTSNTIPTITVTQAPSETSAPAINQPSGQKSAFNWGNPAATAPSPAAQTSGSQPPFAFNTSPAGTAFPSKPTEFVASTDVSAGPSLASRIGGLATPANALGTNPQQLSFAKPAIVSSSSASTQSQVPTSSASAQPKFNFGFPSKFTSVSTPSAPTGAPTGVEPPKPSPSAFGFPSAQPAASSPFAPTNATANGTGSSTAGTSANPFMAPKESASAPKSAFSFGIPASSTPNAFSTAPTSSASNASTALGSSTAPSSKPSFSFGTPSFTAAGAPSSAFSNPTNASNPSTAPSFSFAPAAPGPPSTPAKVEETQSKPKFSFNFGSTTAPTPANGVTNGTVPPAFGGSQPAVGSFAFGASSAPNAFTFGPATSQQQK